MISETLCMKKNINNLCQGLSELLELKAAFLQKRGKEKKEAREAGSVDQLPIVDLSPVLPQTSCAALDKSFAFSATQIFTTTSHTHTHIYLH